MNAIADGAWASAAGWGWGGGGGSTQTQVIAADGETWTILVYVAADNDLESYAVLNINELESVQVDDAVNVAVLADRSTSYSSVSGNWSDTRQTVITYDGGSSTLTSFSSASTSLGELNTGDDSTLTDFINWGVATNPADNYCLILWDHGDGLNGVCSDYASNDELSLSEVSSAISTSVVDSFDLVCFDACLMGLTEVYFELEGLADYVVASQDFIPGEGFDYAGLMETLAVNPTISAEALGSSIVSDYADKYGQQSGVTLSLVDMSETDDLETAMDAFLAAARSATTSDWVLMRSSAQRAYDYTSGYGDNYIDLGDFMDLVASSQVSARLAATAAAVSAQVDEMVVSEDGTVADASGLSIYLPSGRETVTPTYTSNNYAFLESVSWNRYLAML